MHLNALLDVDVVAVETTDELSILLELQAPQSPGQVARPPRTLQVVLDRSGSMSGAPLDAAKAALLKLVDRLAPSDRLGLVTFDDEVRIELPSGPIGDGHAARDAIANVWTGGMTNLSAGLIRGIEEARRAKGDGGATILLLSDGHANGGQTDPDVLRDFAGGVRRDGMTLSTIGIGHGYDELLLSAVAAGGTGNAHFADEPDAIGGALAQEVDGLLDQVVQAATLVVRPGDAVESVTLFNDLPVSPTDGGFVVELGDFAAGEDRKILLNAVIPAMADLGLAEVCRLTLRWTDIATMKTQTVDLPLHVNVVPGDAAAGRIPKAQVRTEFAFQKAQRSRKDAADAMRRGDRDTAVDLLRDAGQMLSGAVAAAPASMADELQHESELLIGDAEATLYDDLNVSAKRNEADYNAKSRKRRAMNESMRRQERERRGYGAGGSGGAGPNGAARGNGGASDDGSDAGDGKFG
jgi:Ca-activated chloride channel family protein